MTRPAKRTTDRERFERWMRRAFNIPASEELDLDEDGQYEIDEWYCAWLAWQAALRSERRKRT
jgi:hypothetical protein